LHDDLEYLNFCPTISAKELSTYATGAVPIEIEPLARNLKAAQTQFLALWRPQLHDETWHFSGLG